MTAILDASPAPVIGGGRLVVSYERVSKFKATNVNAEITRGVERQADDADNLADARALGPVTHLAGDEGISASRFETRDRDDWKQLLALINAGRVSVVLVWVLDRIIRQTRDLDDLLDACRRNGAVIIQTASGSTINPDDPDSVMTAKFAGIIAETEVAKMSMRQKRKHASLADSGQFHGGRRRFGYEPKNAAIRESEAAVIREIARRIIAGESLNGLAKDLNGRGITTSEGSAWRGPNIRKMIMGPHLAGLRVHNGATTPAAWPAIIDRATHEAVKGILTDPARRVGVSQERKYALTGVGRCGVCGGKIRGRMVKPRNGAPYAAYMCETTAHVHRPVKAVDDVVTAWVGEWLATRADAAFFTPAQGAQAQADAAAADAIHAHKKELAAQYGRREFGLDILQTALAAADEELREISARISQGARLPAVLADLAGNPDAARAYSRLPLDRKRAVLEIMPGTVVLLPAAHRGATFDPATVTVDWDDA